MRSIYINYKYVHKNDICMLITWFHYFLLPHERMFQLSHTFTIPNKST